jgi:hypothetical protein
MNADEEQYVHTHPFPDRLLSDSLHLAAQECTHRTRRYYYVCMCYYQESHIYKRMKNEVNDREPNLKQQVIFFDFVAQK